MGRQRDNKFIYMDETYPLYREAMQALDAAKIGPDHPLRRAGGKFKLVRDTVSGIVLAVQDLKSLKTYSCQVDESEDGYPKIAVQGENPKCPSCDTFDFVVSSGYPVRSINGLSVKVHLYRCKRCNKAFHTELTPNFPEKPLASDF